MNLEEATIKALQNKLNESLLYDRYDEVNLKKFDTDPYFALNNPDLIDNLNNYLKSITAQDLIDVVDYYSNVIYGYPDNNTYDQMWENIKFVPKRGNSNSRFARRISGKIIDDDTVKFIVDDGGSYATVKVSTVYLTYKFTGTWL